LKFARHLSRDDRRRVRYQAKKYTIVEDTLYHQGIDSILRRFLNHEEAESVLNDFHKGACGGHLSGLATAQKSRVPINFGPPSLKIPLKQLRSGTPARCSLEKCSRT
jgi:hypothetical protein